MRAAIVGVGSVLMGDDAAGPYLVRLLEARYELPPEVTLLDAGTPGPGFEDLLRGYDASTWPATAPPRRCWWGWFPSRWSWAPA